MKITSVIGNGLKFGIIFSLKQSAILNSAKFVYGSLML